MRTVFVLIEEILRARPGTRAERLTPWIFLVLGGAIILLMVYSCATAKP